MKKTSIITGTGCTLKGAGMFTQYSRKAKGLRKRKQQKSLVTRLQSTLMVMSVFAMSLNVGHAQENGDLGTYGASGDIRRDQLPDGVRDIVSDNAIALASSPTFARARALWNRQTPTRSVNVGNIDFVDQVDYQLSFRSKVDYLDTNPGHIASVLEAKPHNHAIERMSLYLSHAEAREMTRRDKLGAQAPALERIARADDRLGLRSNFAGIWQDQHDGGKLVLAVVDMFALNIDRVHRLVGTRDIKIIEQSYSLAEQNKFKKLLAAELRASGLEFVVRTMKTGNGGKILEVRTPDPGLLPSGFGAEVPDNAYQITRGSTPKSRGGPQTIHDLADQQPGLAVGVLDASVGASAACTWGFNAHTSNFNYIVTAGHCVLRIHPDNGGGQFSGRFGEDIQVWQRTAATFFDERLTPADAFVAAWNTGGADMARIESDYADDNCYHGRSTEAGAGDGGHCLWPMTNRALHNSWTPGMHQTCASLGQSNTYRCGFILEEDVDTGRWERLVYTDLVSTGGDSGSGVKWEYTIDGLLVAGDGETGPSYFHTAYDLQDITGTQFNCAVGETTNRAGDWGSCPGVDRSP